MRKESFEVLSFIRWLIRKKEFLKGLPWIKGKIRLNVVSLFYDLQSQPVLQLQWMRENQIFEMSLEELFAQEQLLHALDQKDLKKIIEIKIDAVLSARLRLVAHFNENNSEKIVYKNKSNQTFVKDISEVRKKEFIQLFSPGDAYLLGYLLAYEDQRQELSPSNITGTQEH